MDVDDSSGKVYVMDRLNHRIESFQPNGTYITKVGARGTQPATFSWPEAVAASPDGTVWGVDTRGGRIEQFTGGLSGTLVTPPVGSGTSVPAGNRLQYPEGADVDANNVVWIADTRNHRIQKSTRSPRPWRWSASAPRAPATASSPSRWVSP